LLAALRTYEGGELAVAAVATLSHDLPGKYFGAPEIVLCP